MVVLVRVVVWRVVVEELEETIAVVVLIWGKSVPWIVVVAVGVVEEVVALYSRVVLAVVVKLTPGPLVAKSKSAVELLAVELRLKLIPAVSLSLMPVAAVMLFLLVVVILSVTLTVVSCTVWLFSGATVGLVLLSTTDGILSTVEFLVDVVDIVVFLKGAVVFCCVSLIGAVVTLSVAVLF